jgi:hypothetical protein
MTLLSLALLSWLDTEVDDTINNAITRTHEMAQKILFVLAIISLSLWQHCIIRGAEVVWYHHNYDTPNP